MNTMNIKRMCRCCGMMQKAFSGEYKRQINKLKDYLEHEKIKIGNSVVHRLAV